MDLVIFLVVIVGVILLTVSLGAIGKHPVFRKIIGSLLWVVLLFVPWVILIRLPYRVIQHILFSVIFGGLLLILQLWTWEPFKVKPRRIVIVTFAAAILLSIVSLVVISLI